MVSVHARWVALVVILVAMPACDGDGGSASRSGLRCAPDATPVLLASRADDEDGDGHILDEHFPDIDDEDDDIADHTWIRDGRGVYHLFFNNEGRGAPWFIEHYTTRSLEHIDYAGTALTAQPGAWDEGGMWAPHVIEAGGTYYMFYTGLDGILPGARQRIGLAVSRDLTHWERVKVNRCPGTSGDGCIYECDEPWTLWSDDTDPFNPQCRDAFILRDDEHDRWLLFATARSTNGYGVVTVAESSDLVTWAGAGFIDATRRLAAGVGAQTTGGQCENPFVVRHEHTNFLLFTDWQDPEDSLGVATPRTIVQYATSPTLDVDAGGSAGWTYRGSTPDPGVNAIEVFEYGLGTCVMSQSLSNPHSGYTRPIRRMLRLRCIEWTGETTFRTVTLGRDGDGGGSPLRP